jgi:phenylpropionate dioxygenase-like ring-hydroxylating dioxygenase large terminal subunit
MLKNFWYALEFGAKVQKAPVPVQALGQRLVLFRGPTGTVAALSDLCIHRGGSLAGGWVEDGCVRCPYHGWKYGESGACVEIPANKKGAPIPQKARVDSYPVIERYGFVWVFLGDLPADKRPPLPHIPEAEEPGWRAVTGEVIWKANYARVCENGVDIAHTPFVHRNSFGNPEHPEIDDYEVKVTDWSCEATATLMPPRPKGLWSLLRRKRTPVKASVKVMMPNLTRLDLDLGKWRNVIIDSNIPIDERTTRTLFVQYRNFFLGGWADKDARRRVYKIFDEDLPTVQAQRPELLPYDLAAELHLKSDAMGVAYRKLRNKYIDMGWGIDSEKLNHDGGRKASVIPSPQRRDEGVPENAWVVPEVPVSRLAKGNGKKQEAM